MKMLYWPKTAKKCLWIKTILAMLGIHGVISVHIIFNRYTIQEVMYSLVSVDETLKNNKTQYGNCPIRLHTADQGW